MTDQEIKDLARRYAEENPPQTEDEKLKEYGIYLNATQGFLLFRLPQHLKLFFSISI